MKKVSILIMMIVLGVFMSGCGKVVSESSSSGGSSGSAVFVQRTEEIQLGNVSLNMTESQLQAAIGAYSIFMSTNITIYNAKDAFIITPNVFTTANTQIELLTASGGTDYKVHKITTYSSAMPLANGIKSGDTLSAIQAAYGTAKVRLMSTFSMPTTTYGETHAWEVSDRNVMFTTNGNTPTASIKNITIIRMYNTGLVYQN